MFLESFSIVIYKDPDNSQALAKKRNSKIKTIVNSIVNQYLNKVFALMRYFKEVLFCCKGKYVKCDSYFVQATSGWRQK